MKKQLITIALALLTAGALSTSCSSDFNIFDTTQQPAGNTITLTATLAPKGGASRDQSGTRSGFGEAQPAFGEAKGDDGGTTRAITPGTDANSKEILNVAWQQGEKIALYYQTSSGYAKATATVQSVDPTTGAATITADLDANTTDGGTVKFVYPSYLANDTGDDIDESKLLNNQRGELTHSGSGTDYSISTKFDAATGEGKIVLNGSTSLPTTASVTNTAGTGNVSLQNRVCICKIALTVKTISTGTSVADLAVPMNDNLTITVSDGHVYTIRAWRNWSDDPYATAPAGATANAGFTSGDNIYVAMLPFEDKTLTFQATASSKNYSTVTKAGTLTAGKFYRNVPVMMVVENPVVTGTITQTLTVPAGMTLTVNDATFNVPDNSPAIKCENNATLILTGTNTIRGTDAPAIQCDGKASITFNGTNTLTSVRAAAIQCDGNTTIDLTNDANTINATPAGQKGIQIADGKSLNITGTGSMTVTGGIGVGSGATLKFNGQAASHNIYIPDGATVSNSGVRISNTVTIGSGETFTLSWTTINVASGPGIQCSGNATIILDGTNNVTTAADSYPAIQAGGSGTTLTIQGSGSVTAWGGLYAAGIGTGRIGICGDISISGGTVTARGGQLGAGIGTGAGGTCGNIIITGGTIKATGVSGGAGIGSGDNGKFESINITDGITKVEAIRQTYIAEPIGKGTSDKGSGTVTIDGTTSWTAGTATEHLNFTVNNADPPCWKLTHK